MMYTATLSSAGNRSSRKRNACFLRCLLCSAILAVGQASIAFSQQEQQSEAYSYVSDMWQVYVDRCGLALEDQQEFLDTLPATNTQGGPSSVTTANQMVMVSSTATDGFTVDVEVITVSDGVHIGCHVFPSIGRFFELENSSAVEIETDLEEFLVAQGLNAPVGGELKNAYSDPQDGDVLEYIYYVENDALGKTALTIFDMTEEYLDVRFARIFVPTRE